MKKIRLFLSSPSDVEEERKRVPAVVAEVNRMLGDRLGFHLDVLDWKTDVVGDMGRPQEVINRQVRGYDILVGIMWKRFGTPTGVAVSGTEEEFNIAYENWKVYGRPRILFYFSKASYRLKSDEELSQLSKVLSFKKKLWEKGLPHEYESPQEFADMPDRKGVSSLLFERKWT